MMNTNLIEKVLSQTATQAEKKELDDWLNESEANREYFEKAKVIWTGLDGVYNKADFNKASAKQKISYGIISRKRKSKLAKLVTRISVAASILLLIGIGWLIYDYSIYPKQNNVVYATGNTAEEFILSDGSHVWLNAYSSITLPGDFSQKQRKVFLKGEAYFEVKRDETSPFKVYAGKTITEVLGTSFNIVEDTISGDVNIVVNTGRIAFYNSRKKRDKEILLPNDLAIFYEKEQLIKVTHNDNLNFLSWKTGLLKFYNTPIDQVCLQLSKHYNENIKANTSLSDLKLTGIFHSNSLDDILATIQLTLDVKISKLNNQYLIDKQ